MREWAIFLVMAVLGAFLAQPSQAFAAPGDRVLVNQVQLWAPCSYDQQNFPNLLKNVGEILQVIPKDYYDIRKFQASGGGLGKPAHASFTVKVPMLMKMVFPGKQQGDITLSVQNIACDKGSGYRLNLDFSKSSPTVTNDYNTLQLDLCDFQQTAVGSKDRGEYVMNATAYAIEGPARSKVLGPEILNVMKDTTALDLENALENVFRGRPVGAPQ